MKALAAICLSICFLSMPLLVSTGGSALAQETNADNEIEALRQQNESLKKELETVRGLLERLREQKHVVTTTKVSRVVAGKESPKPVEVTVKSTRVRQPRVGVTKATNARGTYVLSTSRPEKTVRIVSTRPPEEGVYTMTSTASSNVRRSIELRKWELESVTLSHGDAGLETLLRFEKAKVCRKANMLDEAVEELKKIIDQNVSDVTTHAARLTLVEILQQQKKDREAIAELEKIIATATDTRSKRDAIYGIINLSGDDPQAKIRTIDRLLEKLREKPSEKETPPAEE